MLTRWVALMIQLEQQQHGEFVGGWVGWVGGWLTPTTYIQLAGAGSITIFLFEYQMDVIQKISNILMIMIVLLKASKNNKELEKDNAVDIHTRNFLNNSGVW